MWYLRPLLLTRGVYIRRHLLFGWIHLVQKRVHFSGARQITADVVQTWFKDGQLWETVAWLDVCSQLTFSGLA